MVYPEKLTLDQIPKKHSTISTSSWCNEPLENNKRSANIHNSISGECDKNNLASSEELNTTV